MVCRTNFSAERLGSVDARLSLDIDKDEVVGAAPEKGETFRMAEGGVYFETRDT